MIRTLSEAATNRHDDEEINRSSIVGSFAPKATVKTKGMEELFSMIIHFFSLLLVLPRLYERLCEEKADEDEADSSNMLKRHRSLSSRTLFILTEKI